MDEERMQRLREASEWMVHLGSEECSADDTAAWLRWCDASPENLQAFQSLQRDWRDLDALKGIQPASAAMAGVSHSARWRVAAAVVFALLVGATVTYWISGRHKVEELAAAQSNDTATLSDGSSVVLGARTTVDVDFRGSERHLDLSEGRAYFKVQHDARHPFVVRAGEVNVTAVGTAFDVRREKDRVTVVVEEGVVQVASKAHPGVPPVTWKAEAGYQLAYSTREHTATIARIDPSTALRWRTGELAYVWEPLGAVVADVNRYSSRRITLTDEHLASMHFTGTVFASSVDDWLKAIQQAYPLHVRQTPDGDVILEPNP